MSVDPQRPPGSETFAAAGPHLAVVGGGIIGLTAALAAADDGWRVTVYDAGIGRRAAWVAGGMLGSLGEGLPGEEALFDITVDSVRRWHTLLDRLADPDLLVATNSLFVASTAADDGHLRQLAEFVWAAQPGGDAFPAERLRRVDGAEVKSLEPALARMRGGYLAAGEYALDNRKVLETLANKLGAAGGTVVHRGVDRLDDLDADQVLIAAGLGSSAFVEDLPLYAAKGEILRLTRDRWSVPPPRHVVRARVRGRAVYLVPRADGIVVGATQYEDPADSPAAGVGGVTDLLTDAAEVFPGIRDYGLAEVGVGWRPSTPDGLPIIRRVDERTVVATGHGRNGILLAPHTAAAVTALLAGAPAQSEVEVASSEREKI